MKGTMTVKVKREKLFSVKDMQDEIKRLEAELAALRARCERLVEAARKSDKVYIKMLKDFSGNLDYSRNYSQFIEKLLMELRAALEPFKEVQRE